VNSNYASTQKPDESEFLTSCGGGNVTSDTTRGKGRDRFQRIRGKGDAKSSIHPPAEEKNREYYDRHRLNDESGRSRGGEPEETKIGDKR